MLHLTVFLVDQQLWYFYIVYICIFHYMLSFNENILVFIKPVAIHKNVIYTECKMLFIYGNDTSIIF